MKNVLKALVALIMLVPGYLLVVNAFKSQDDITGNPFGIPFDRLSISYLTATLSDPNYSLVRAYLVTALFAIAVNVLSLAVSAPAAYVIARGTRVRHRALLGLFLLGLFIPSQVLVIPVIYVLKFLGLMGTVTGFLLYETTLTLPVSMFLYVAYIKTLPRELDEAARVDGAGPIVTFWRVILPLMRPAVATAVVLHTIGVWTDFVNPQIILGPGSALYTVTTSVYAAIGRYSTDFTVVYPNLLMAVAPVLIFFVLLQRNIVSGLTAGATKG
ncbi:carbohydrate ABC transporter permease [Actinoplanes sp. TRM 88003]|uniref:Carbohydrate ABC transporter permease n=1 Tax=Paractinoplanes aksuensis TaxID=2939490 RepID=A0ABT1E6I8_9ACTN|nr:carbohydrate ABC transporter permease [Actinoplanes aksuensis]MCO8277765.1 carbohydrate ABC transporter permease [Actinoplanes aksuensis]